MLVTIYDIAKKLGCSPSTVSLALNDSPKIPDTTKEKVRNTARELGYTPNYAARCLINNQTHTIGVIAPNLSNPLFCMMVSGIASTANELGYSIILGLSEQSVDKEKSNIQMLSERRVDGLVVFPSFPDETLPSFVDRDDSRIPIVLCGSSNKYNDNISFVKCDNHMGGYIATEHLIKNGCKRIACVCATVKKGQATSRVSGYENALEFYNIPLDENLIAYCSQDFDDIFNTTVNLIENHNIDAVFCLYDYMSLPVIRAALSLNKRIPEDIAIIGYDNIDIASQLPIPLSSINTHAYTVGSLAAKHLINKMQNPDDEVKKILLKPEIIIRQSSEKK